MPSGDSGEIDRSNNLAIQHLPGWSNSGTAIHAERVVTASRGTLPDSSAGARLRRVTEAGPGPEDPKIVTLARAARARGGPAGGAAVPEETGRADAAAARPPPAPRRSAPTPSPAL